MYLCTQATGGVRMEREGTVAILDMDVKMVRYIGGRVQRCACTGSVFLVEGRGAEGSSSPTRWSICHHKGQG